MTNSKTALKAAAAIILSAVVMTPVAAVAEAGSEDDIGGTFVLPMPQDQDGPTVTARPVAAVEQSILDDVATEPNDFDALVTLTPVPVRQEAAVVVVAEASPVAEDAETAMWRQADASGDAERVKVYMLTYPQGRYLDEAKARFVALLRAIPRTPTATPAVIYQQVPVPAPAPLPAREYRRHPHKDVPPFNRGRPFQDPHRRGFL